jgi:hypothetical protein
MSTEYAKAYEINSLLNAEEVCRSNASSKQSRRVSGGFS